MSDSEPRRRRRKLKSLSERVPYDVVIDILSRLPVKSLIRFRCVSKSWYSTITDPIFITKHFNHNKAKSLSSNSNHNGFLLYICKKQMCTAVCNGDPKLTLTTTTEVSRFQIPFTVYSYKISFCNGMFLIYEYRRDRTIYLWNPSIQKFKIFADAPTDFTSGLAYHSKNNDFKILKIAFHPTLVYNKRPLFEAKVYTLSTDLWRRVEFSVESVPNFRYIHEIQHEPFLFCNGALHFMTYPRVKNNTNNFILSFDINDEIFREIRLPENIGGIQDFQLAVFKGSLALIASGIARFEDFRATYTCVVWVMRRYGVVESWTKKTIAVKPGGPLQKFLGCTDSGQLLFFHMSGRIVSYDPESGSRNQSNIGIPHPYWLGYTTDLMESLVLLDHK